LLKRAVIFDLDDTLVAFDAVSEPSWLQVCREYTQTGSGRKAQRIFEAIKKHSDWYWDDDIRHREGRLDIKAARRSIVSAAFSELGLPPAEAVSLADRYSAVRLDNMYLYPGVESTLQALCNRHFEMAILTNGESATQREKINRFGLGKYFSHIFIEGEVGSGKPGHEIYRKALSDIGVSPAETYMVGDNIEWDIAAPQALGISGIWYDSEGTGLPPDAPAVPFRTILNITELLDILKT
jgi:putative hydrolase of the HAD superfamily